MRTRCLVVSAAAMFTLAACGSGAPSAAPSPANPSTSASSGSGTAGGCADVTAPAPKSADVAQPSGALEAGKTYTVTLQTSCGDIMIKLDQTNNPKTANSVAHLVREGYYNQTVFHRVVPGFVIQGGDPAGDGTGGPSWKVVEAPPADTQYSKGVVAMAKTGAEAAGTSGSQFFIVVADGVSLPPDYAVAGTVSGGQDVADRIAALGTEGSDGPPSKPVVVNAAQLSEQ